MMAAEFPPPVAPAVAAGNLLGVVVVVYKSFDDTVRFVREELPKITCPYRAVVVDLGSEIAFTRKLAVACGAELVEDGAIANPGRSVYFLHCSENLGYAKGNNLGAEFLLTNVAAVRWFLFSNNDIVIKTPGAVAALVRKLDELPDIAVVGPRVLGPDGADQSPLYEPVALTDIIWRELLSPPLCARLMPGRFQPRSAEHSRACRCYAVMGCFLVVDAGDFIRAEQFDPATFLYREEEILSERLRRLERGVYFFPAVRVRHLGGRTVGRYLDYARVNRLHFESDCYYYRTYRGAGRFQLALFHLAKKVSLFRAGTRRLIRSLWPTRKDMTPHA